MSDNVLTDDLWFELFRPQQNHLKPNSQWGGVMYETYGAELEFVMNTPTTQIWTYVDGDDGTYLVSGFSYVNRIGYFICEVGMADFVAIQVSQDCEDCNQSLDTVSSSNNTEMEDQ